MDKRGLRFTDERDEHPKEYVQDEIPGLELRTILEGMSVEERETEKQRCLDEINEREKLVWAINTVNDAEGVNGWGDN